MLKIINLADKLWKLEISPVAPLKLFRIRIISFSEQNVLKVVNRLCLVLLPRLENIIECCEDSREQIIRRRRVYSFQTRIGRRRERSLFSAC